MGRFLLWWLTHAIAVFIISAVLPGVTLEEGILPLVLVSLIIGLVNAALRPILYFAGCGLIILTLGLAIPVLNALLLLLADRIAGDWFTIDGIGWAILAALMMTVISIIMNQLLKPPKSQDDGEKRKRVMYIDAK